VRNGTIAVTASEDIVASLSASAGRTARCCR
jgi:hypothetical protein